MAPTAAGEAAAAVQPAWKNLKGMKRVQAEFKHLSKDIAAGKFTFVKELSLAGDDMLTWHLKLWHFDDDCEGGKNLNKDLEQLNRRYGQDHILMEISFPKDYPHQPFFIRVISPRCVMYTGHVTAGGSVCLESLTLSGTPGSWQPDFSVESLLNVVLINMIDCPVTIVQTATGPGGVSGPLRIDFNHYRPTSGYSSAEAKAAFARTLENHKRMGWGGDGEAAAGGAGASRPGPGAGTSRQASRTAPGAAAAAAAAAGMAATLKSSDGVLQSRRVSTPVMNNSAGGAVVAAADDDTDTAGYRKRRNNAAAAAAAQSSAAGAGAGSKPAGIGSGLPDRHQQQRWRPVPKRKWSAPTAAAAAAADDTGSDVVMLVSDSDDEEQQLRAAIEASLRVHTGAVSPGAAAAADHDSRRGGTGHTASSHAALADQDQQLQAALKKSLGVTGPAAAAAAAGRRATGRAARGLPSAAALDVDDDIAIVDPGRPRDRQQRQQQGLAAAGGNGNARPVIPALRQQLSQRAIAGIIGDSDSDRDEVVSLATPTHKRRAQEKGTAAAAAAAAAAAPAGSIHKRRAQEKGAAAAAAAAGGAGAVRRNAAQQQDDVIVLGSQDGNNDDVQVVGGTHAPAAAAAAAVGASLKRVRRVIQDLSRNQQQRRPQQQQLTRHQSSTTPSHPAPRVQLWQPQPQRAAAAAAGLQPVQLQQQIARVQQQLHAPDGFVGARVHLQLEYPSYWDYSQPVDTSTVRLVPLPLNGNAQALVQHPSDPLEAAAAAAQLSDEDIDQLEMQGLSRADALAALLLADGNADEAEVRAITCLEVGGCAAVWRNMHVPQRAPRNRDAQQQQQQQVEAAARRVAEEVESILAMFDSTGNGQVDRSKIVSIERIQHSKLWRRYCLKRQEMIESRGEEGLNERLLFHGTSPSVADIIVKEGFDFRLVSHASSYGNGTYFADHSHTAFGYCAKPDMSAAANGHFGPGGGWGAGMLGSAGFGFGAPPFLAPPPPPPFMPYMPPGVGAAGVPGMSNLPGTYQGGHTGPGRIPKTAVRSALQQRSAPGCYKMLVARVALGKQATGQSGMRKPPEGHDSVNSGSAAVPGVVAAGGSRYAYSRGGKSSGRKGAAWGAQQGRQYFCHVVFDNDQCYPEYLITFRPR